MRLQDLTPDDPDVKHLEELGLVRWVQGRLVATVAGIKILKEELLAREEVSSAG